MSRVDDQVLAGWIEGRCGANGAKDIGRFQWSQVVRKGSRLAGFGRFFTFSRSFARAAAFTLLLSSAWVALSSSHKTIPKATFFPENTTSRCVRVWDELVSGRL